MLVCGEIFGAKVILLSLSLWYNKSKMQQKYYNNEK